jgi:LacI family transcriptional regulator
MAGLEAPPVLRAEATTYQMGYQLMEQALCHRPDAVLAINDVMAMGSIDAAANAGLRVPDDVAVTGFDDIGAAHRFVVPLTTVRQPKKNLGRVAARQLLYRIQEPDAPQQRTLLATSLVVRRSCGCCGLNTGHADRLPINES